MPHAECAINDQSPEAERLRLEVQGLVQGVGFRPFVCRLARELSLSGWVQNANTGAIIEIQGHSRYVADFCRRLALEAPTHVRMHEVRAGSVLPSPAEDFVIRESEVAGRLVAWMQPDLATCVACRNELFDSGDQRYRYPFICCTECGPRFSIIQSLPYDRSNTTMRGFAMCPHCQAEYVDPANRRFYAQANACPDCGPQLALWDGTGDILAQRDDALLAAEEELKRGRIVALKGLGGFQLLADGRDEAAVRRLRHRKLRAAKPFAVMLPDIAAVRRFCTVSPEEEALLNSAASPIVLLARLTTADELATAVAPGNPFLGVMLPYTPLHHLLMADLRMPVVATSGNCADEPICTEEAEALKHLAGVADVFLIHDRSIVRPVDDSVAQVVLGKTMLLRRARGFAPLPIDLRDELPNLLAVGGQLKATVAISMERHVLLSQHLGDLDTAPARTGFRQALDDLPRLYDFRPVTIACDRHPDYISTELAARMNLPLSRVQHHEAHVRACMAEHRLRGPVLGVAWDGTGLGTDGTIWGGEFLLVDGPSCRRVGHLRPFRLPGGDAASREPRRSAIAVLYETFGDEVLAREDIVSIRQFSAAERKVLHKMLNAGINAPWTSSAGRLFDAVASLLDLRQVSRFEGDAALAVQFAATGSDFAPPFPFTIAVDGEIDWRPMILTILREPANAAARFHATLVEMIHQFAGRLAESCVVLCGGSFQNRILLEATVRQLEEAGHDVFWPQKVPTNDGGLALGQIMAAAWQLKPQG